MEIFYVHNAIEGRNVEEELKSVAEAAKAKIEAIGGEEVVVSSREFGLGRIQELYKSRNAEILVDATVRIPSKALAKESGEGWEAIVVTVEGGWLQGLYRKYGNDLFSANFRDYMGANQRKGNINQGIRNTVATEPSNLWVYNNGVTALTHRIKIKNGKFSATGISIINGAQSTGAVGESEDGDAEKARVLFRLVQCNSPELIEKIIRFNNTQNVIKPSDQRSKDAVQIRLANAFKIYGVSYVHRRSFSVVRGLKNPISAAAVGAWLCAFHGDPQTAARNSASIFQSDATYQQVFRKDIVAEHLYMVRSLASAIDDMKLSLKRKIAADTATELESKQYEVLKYSMSKYFILFVIGKMAEEILGSRVTDLFGWKAKPEVIGPEKSVMIKSWRTVLEALLPFITTSVSGQGETYDVVRSSSASKKVLDMLKPLLAALKVNLATPFESVRKKTVW